jgi:hypothetical protein
MGNNLKFSLMKKNERQKYIFKSLNYQEVINSNYLTGSDNYLPIKATALTKIKMNGCETAVYLHLRGISYFVVKLSITL